MTRREFEITDPEEILSILKTCKYLHLGLVDEGMPYVLPMNYGFIMDEGKLTIYLHGAAKGYKLDVIEKSPACCFEMECEVAPFEGRVACQYGMADKSLIRRGEAHIVSDVEEKIKALTLLMKNQTGKDFEFNEKLVSIVSVIRLDITEYSAKKRNPPANPTA